MPILLVMVLLLIAEQGLATTVANQVQSLVGKKLTGSVAIINKINEVDDLGRNALHHAIMLRNLPLVEFFLANGVDTRAADHNNLIPLQYVEQMIDQQPSVELMKIMSLVLEKTHGLNKGDVKGWRPIVWSLMAGDYPRVIELRDRGADIFAGRLPWPNPRKQIAGHHNAVWAAEHLEDDRAIEILAESAPDRYFSIAVNKGYQRFVQAMIARGVDINVKDYPGYSAAMRAAKAGRLKDLQMLIDHGARIDIEVLIWAIYSGNPKLIEMIIDHDASLVPQLAIYQTMYGHKRFGMPKVDELLANNSRSKGGRRINQMLEEATIGMPTLPATVIAKLKKLRATELVEMEFGMKNIHGETTTKRYSEGDSLLKVAVHQGLEQEVKQLLDYLSGTPIFIPIVNRAFKNTTRGSRPQPETLNMLLSNLAEVMNNWQPETIDQPQLLDTLRIAMTNEHKAAIEVILDNLGNDGTIVYQELLRGLALANKNTNLAKLLLTRAVIAGIDREKLIDHAGILEKKLSSTVIRIDENPTGRAFSQAIEHNDQQTIQQLIDHGLEMDGFPWELFFYKLTPELLELFVDRQIISLDMISRQIEDNRKGILSAAAYSGNFPIIEKIISLGGKFGLDQALLDVSFRGGPTPKDKTERAEFEKKVLATMKLLIDTGAKAGFTDRWGRTPLTQAIGSFQPSRVEFLLEQQGGVAGHIDYALRELSRTINIIRNRSGDEARVRGLEKNMAEIKQLLVDKGLVQP